MRCPFKLRTNEVVGFQFAVICDLLSPLLAMASNSLCSFIHSFTVYFIHPFIHSFIDLICLFTYSLFNIYLFIYFFIHHTDQSNSQVTVSLHFQLAVTFDSVCIAIGMSLLNGYKYFKENTRAEIKRT